MILPENACSNTVPLKEYFQDNHSFDFDNTTIIKLITEGESGR